MADYTSSYTGAQIDSSVSKSQTLATAEEINRAVKIFGSGTTLAGTEVLTSLAVGAYSAQTGDVAVALQGVATGNCPTDNNFILYVINRINAPRKTLILIDSNGGIFVKSQTASSTFSSWKTVTMTAVT